MPTILNTASPLQFLDATLPECQRRLNFDPLQLENAEVNLTPLGTCY